MHGEAPGGDVREVERGRPEPADTRGAPHRSGEHGKVRRVARGSARVRDAGRDQRAREVRVRRDAEAGPVEPCPAPLLGDERLVLRGVEHHPGDDAAAALERDRYGEMRNAVDEVGRAVERIDDVPVGVGTGSAWRRSALLADEPTAGVRAEQGALERLLGLEVRGGDEIRRALEVDLELGTPAEVVHQPFARAARRTHHRRQLGRGVEHRRLMPHPAR